MKRFVLKVSITIELFGFWFDACDKKQIRLLRLLYIQYTVVLIKKKRYRIITFIFR